MTRDLPPKSGRKPRFEPHFKDIMRRIYIISETQTQVQLATFLGIGQASVSDAQKRGSVPAEWLLTLLEKKNVHPRWIRTGEGPMFVGTASDNSHAEYTLPAGNSENTLNPDTRTVPVHALECAADGSFPGAETGEYLTLPASWVDGLAVCRAGNAVMIPIVATGAYVGLALENTEFRNGGLYAVKTAWAGVTLRRAYVDATETGVVLKALDQDCPSLHFSVETFRQRVVGRVEWIRQRV